ncbi:sensor histidine kinase [Amycolatopsis sp. NBC_01480]|uniref:sensor histidine kinase n=1 Tax=Amycolatopsis sp. NBC_01480 TaxID=2903562 RepID=UPI002E2B6E3E|nr:HAMP domain-containing sensor histidine kinase [Amycolatopsis sp. NBC_01480]
MTLPVRARLGLLCGTLMVVSSVVLLAAVYLLLSANLPSRFDAVAVRLRPDGAAEVAAVGGRAEPFLSAALGQYVLWSVLSLVLLGVAAVAVGWWVSGRALRPLRRMTATARRLSSQNLRERIALTGPKDELTDLAATIDEMLDRLEAAFTSQRRFIANASHELRTPLAVQRTALQVGLADPISKEVALIRDRLLADNRRSERLIEGLLLLARSDQGLLAPEPVRLDEVVEDVLTRQRPGPDPTFETELHPAPIRGDALLLTHLVGNLITNAVRYNTEGGTVWVRTTPGGLLEVRNTGLLVAPETVAQLTEPFRRGAGRTHSAADGCGLGLSIVDSVTSAHHGTLTLAARPEGGLCVRVALPVAGG